jgi:hypothetical protein
MEQQDTNRADRILNSINGLQKATAPDFFYTRLIGRMQQEMEPKRKPFFLLRPAFVAAALSVVLIVNIISLTRLNKQPEQKATIPSNKPATIESFAKAYDLNTDSVYE